MPRLPLLLAALLITGCAHKVHRFADAPPVWVDADMNHLGERPSKYWSGLAWDGADQTVFRPTHRALGLAVAPRARNINAWDEVANSSWFHNRIGVRTMSDEELAQGACPDELLDTAGPWMVIGAKPNGANPGFIIKGPNGNGWLLKMDGHKQPERATTADVLGSRLYHAVGYHSPCNIVVFFDSKILKIDPDATTEDELGRDQPMTQDDVDRVLAAAGVLPDGRVRASASKWLTGRPIGPWTYQGKRRDDPNDVIKHQDRREIRGAKLMAAWTNHFDAREQNTLATFHTEEDGRSYVKHYYLDFGDTLGSIWWWEPMSLSHRFGYSYYFDAGDVLVDYATLGTLKRPWNQLEMSDKAPIGFFTDEPFKPHRYKPGYPNPAFLRMRPEDGAWMARILARVDDHSLQVMLEQGRMHNKPAEAEIHRILAARRDAILEHYLQVRSPLAEFRVDGTRLCFTDLAVLTGVFTSATYQMRTWRAPFDSASPQSPLTADPAGAVCADVSPGASGDPYTIIDLLVQPSGDDAPPPARVHLIVDGDNTRIVGIERPRRDRPPGAR